MENKWHYLLQENYSARESSTYVSVSFLQCKVAHYVSRNLQPMSLTYANTMLTS